jgi:Tfp pilus assembly protein PilF
VTESVAKEDDASALLLVYRAGAARTGIPRRSGVDHVRRRSGTWALFERSTNYLRQGKKAQAREDLKRILADDTDYGGVRDGLA